MPKTIKSYLKNKDSFSKPQLLIFLLVFSITGAIVLISTHAAPNPNLPGDLNNDNVVDISDLSILASNYKTSNAVADINTDGIVNISDLSILLSNYGRTLTATGTVPAATVSHVIDGNLNEADWNLSSSVTKSVIGTANNTTTFGTLWDSTYLYVGVKVLDSSLQNDSANCWDDDSVEVYIDPTNAGGTTYTGNDRQIVQRWNDAGICTGIGSNTGVLHAWKAITGGYSVELAIPWSNLGVSASSGKTIGFDVGVNDDDDGGARDTQAVWNGTVNDSQDPSGFAHLTLSGSPPSQPTVTFSANPTSVSSGASSTLSWSSTNATACTASGAWSGSKATSGSASTGALSQTSTFTLTCTGPGGSAVGSATVTVSGSGALRFGTIENISGGGSQSRLLAIGAKLIREDINDSGAAMTWAKANGIDTIQIVELGNTGAADCRAYAFEAGGNEPYWHDVDPAAWARSTYSDVLALKAKCPGVPIITSLVSYGSTAGASGMDGNLYPGQYVYPNDKAGVLPYMQGHASWVNTVNAASPNLLGAVDGFSVHPYFNSPPFTVLNVVRSELTALGHNQKFWITEDGAYVGTEANQAAYATQALAAVRARTDVFCYLWYRLSENSESSASWGLYNADGTQRQAYTILKAAM